MGSYVDLKRKISDEFNAFPMGAAFSDKQFEEMMQKWGLAKDDTDKICSLGYGAFIRKSDSDALHEMYERHRRWEREAMANDKTGDGYIYDMFDYELANHEFGYTYELDETLEAVDLTMDQIMADKRLKHGLEKALRPYYDYPVKLDMEGAEQ